MNQGCGNGRRLTLANVGAPEDTSPQFKSKLRATSLTKMIRRTSRLRRRPGEDQLLRSVEAPREAGYARVHRLPSGAEVVPDRPRPVQTPVLVRVLQRGAGKQFAVLREGDEQHAVTQPLGRGEHQGRRHVRVGRQQRLEQRPPEPSVSRCERQNGRLRSSRCREGCGIRTGGSGPRSGRRSPSADVMAAGGWKDTQTLLTCYQHADEETMLRVMEAPVKLLSRRRVQQG